MIVTPERSFTDARASKPGLFQVAECYLQLRERVPRRAGRQRLQ